MTVPVGVTEASTTIAGATTSMPKIPSVNVKQPQDTQSAAAKVESSKVAKDVFPTEEKIIPASNMTGKMGAKDKVKAEKTSNNAINGNPVKKPF